MSKTLQYTLFAAFILFVAYKMWGTHQDKKRSLDWPTTTGQLTMGRVKEVSSSSRSDKRPSHSDHYFTLTLDYSYRVDGQDFIGHNLKVGGSRFLSEQQAADALKELEGMESLTVHYDPKDPETSVLKPG